MFGCNDCSTISESLPNYSFDFSLNDCLSYPDSSSNYLNDSEFLTMNGDFYNPWTSLHLMAFPDSPTMTPMSNSNINSDLGSCDPVSDLVELLPPSDAIPVPANLVAKNTISKAVTIQKRKTSKKPMFRSFSYRQNSKQFSSHFRGVYRKNSKFQAQIQYNKKKHYLGTFDTELEAAKKYDIAALRLHGKSAQLNFAITESCPCESCAYCDKFRDPKFYNNLKNYVIHSSKVTSSIDDNSVASSESCLSPNCILYQSQSVSSSLSSNSIPSSSFSSVSPLLSSPFNSIPSNSSSFPSNLPSFPFLSPSSPLSLSSNTNINNTQNDPLAILTQYYSQLLEHFTSDIYICQECVDKLLSKLDIKNIVEINRLVSLCKQQGIVFSHVTCH
ncbi:hypothetical protein WA158_002064 [Blastocystis sp. Blastoise]